ncbi:hypothetical protein GCM10009712_08360 [Pseudarthrobacter sulfonivorans]
MVVASQTNFVRPFGSCQAGTTSTSSGRAVSGSRPGPSLIVITSRVDSGPPSVTRALSQQLRPRGGTCFTNAGQFIEQPGHPYSSMVATVVVLSIRLDRDDATPPNSHLAAVPAERDPAAVDR